MPITKKTFNVTNKLDEALMEMEGILESHISSKEDAFEELKSSMKTFIEKATTEECVQEIKILSGAQNALVKQVQSVNQLQSFTEKLRKIVLENAKIQKQKQTQQKGGSADTPRAKKSKLQNFSEDLLVIDETYTAPENSAINSNENYSSCHIDKTLDYLLERRKTPPPSFSPERLQSPPRLIKTLWCPPSPTKEPPVCYWGI